MKNIFEPRYVLAVKNLETSSLYYQNVLGFKQDSQFPGWDFLSRDSCYLMLGECADEIPAAQTGNHSYFAYLEVQDAKALYNEFKSKGAEFVKKMKDEPWGMREFGIRTIDGHRMMFGQEIDTLTTSD